MNKRECLTDLAALSAAIGKPMSEAQADIYFECLRDLDYLAFHAGVIRALQEHKISTIPTIAELRELSGVINPKSRAALCWEAVYRAIGDIGGYELVDFDDPVANATIANLGGWIELTGRTTEELQKFVRRDFERIYGAYCERGITAEEAKPLRGILDHDNAGRGITRPTIRIECGLPAHRRGLIAGEALEVRRLVDSATPKGIE